MKRNGRLDWLTGTSIPDMVLKATVAGMVADQLVDFTGSPFSHDGVTYEVFHKPGVSGGPPRVRPRNEESGRDSTSEVSRDVEPTLAPRPAVIVMAEIPGITPTVADFARRVADRGLNVYMPDLFGVAGEPRSAKAMLKVLPKACVAREFSALALRTTAPIVEWLRALARHANEECGRAGVGAVGMCFTGGFALAMATEPEMLAPVMSQPSLPMFFRPGARDDAGCSDADLAKVLRRCRDDDLQVMGLRFSEDRLSPKGRFSLLNQVLGQSFIEVPIDSGCRNPSGHSLFAHSVLTEDLIDRPGEPTRAALEQVLDFLEQRLAG